MDSFGDKKYALYKTFSVGSKYELSVDKFSGTAGKLSIKLNNTSVSDTNCEQQDY